jgi:Na+/proline symporter
MAEKKPVKYRINILVGLALIAIAGYFDLIELILSLVSVGAASYIKDFAQIILFPVIFWVLKAPFWKGKRKAKKMISMLSGFFVALIPFVSDVLPEVMISVALTIYYTRKEDVLAMLSSEAAEIRDRNITRYKNARPKIRERARRIGKSN